LSSVLAPSKSGRSRPSLSRAELATTPAWVSISTRRPPMRSAAKPRISTTSTRAVMVKATNTSRSVKPLLFDTAVKTGGLAPRQSQGRDGAPARQPIDEHIGFGAAPSEVDATAGGAAIGEEADASLLGADAVRGGGVERRLQALRQA